MFKQKFQICILFFVSNVIYLKCENNVKILITSIPKCGTWMLDKCVNLLTDKKNALPRFHEEGLLRNPMAPINAIQLFRPSIDILNKCTDLKKNEYLISHLIFDINYEDLLAKKNFKVLLIIRDPRDQLVSRVFYTLKNKKIFSGLQNFTFNELLEAYIGSVNDLPYDNLFTSHISYQNKPKQQFISNIMQFYLAYLPWIESKICYVTKFENLVGIKGEGDSKLQLEEIKHISLFLNIYIDNKKLLFVQDNLFGGSGTFREGKIGSWKKYFTRKHKDQFKKVAGQLLIDLGYEKSLDW